MSEHWSDFVEESNERITQLNNELLTLERDPDDEEAMRHIFRIAHTLKGNAGAAGFESASDLAHAIEDLLDAIRAGRLEVSPELMDVVFDAVDEFEAMVDEIDATGEIQRDPSPTIHRLRDELEVEPTATSVDAPTADAIDSIVSQLDPPEDDSHDAYLVRFAVVEDSDEETTNGMLVLEALIDAFDLVGTDPTPDRIAAGEYDGRLEAVFGSAVGKTAIGAALEPIDVIADFEIVDVTDRIDATQSQRDGSAANLAGQTLSQADAQALEVDDLLDEFQEFDDLEQKVEEVENDDDLEVFDEMGEAGSFDDLFEDADTVDTDLEPGGPPADAAAASPDDGADAGDEPSTDTDDADDVDDAGAVFEELKDEVDPVGFEELQDELDELEFDEFDEEEVGMDDLLGDELEDESTDASVSEPADSSGGATTPSIDESAESSLEASATAAGEPTDGPDVAANSESVPESASVVDSEAGADAETVANRDTETTADAATADESATRRGVDRIDDADSSVLDETSRTAAEDDGPETVAEDADPEPDRGELEESGTATEAADSSTADAPGVSPPDPVGTAFEDATSDESESGDTAADDIGPADRESGDLESDDGALGSGPDTESEDPFATSFDRDPFDTPETEPDSSASDLDTETSDLDGEVSETEDVDFDGFDSDFDAPETNFEVSTSDVDLSETEFDDGIDAPSTPADDPKDSTDTDLEDEPFGQSESGFDDESFESSADAGNDDWTVREESADASSESDDDPFESTETAAFEEGPDTDGFEEGPNTDGLEEGPDTADIEESVGSDDIGGVTGDDALEGLSDADFDKSAETAGFDESTEMGDLDEQTETGDLEETADFDESTEMADFDESTTFDASDDDAATDLLDLEGDAGDSFEETFGIDALEDDSLEDDDGWFETDDTVSTGTGAGDDPDSPADDDVVTTFEEPSLEIPDVSVPETTDREDSEGVADETQSVRVDVEQIDDLLNLVEGLVTSRVRLRHAVETDLDREAITTELDDLEDLLGELQGTVMDVRLVPLETVTNRLPRVVRDVAREQDKAATVEIRGADVEIDRTILDRLRDPLVHLVRNAVDHGIEPPAQREAADKPSDGQIEVTATRARDQVTITVADDGRGLDPDELRAEAVDVGVCTADEAAAMSDDEAFELVFHPGLSTTEEVTDVSGRGVGMDVVERTVTELDGTISIDSDDGAGTTVTMTLPVSIAIDDVLFVECGGEEFGVPTTAVQDVEPVETAQPVDGEDAVAVDDDQYPVLSLAEELETPPRDATGEGMLVRIREDVRPVALECDSIHGQQEVVVKPFEGFMRDIPGLSGATVRGRGEVVNILDVTTL